jgi:hypothetical protein
VPQVLWFTGGYIYVERGVRKLLEAPRSRSSKAILALLKTTWVYGLITWLYVVSNLYVFPEFQFVDLSRYVPVPTDLVGIVAFAASAASFAGWEYLRRP